MPTSPKRVRQRTSDPQGNSFRKFYVTYYPFVKQAAIYSCASFEEAEFVAQETMVKAWRAFDRFDHQYPKAWLRRILGRVVIDRYHRLKKQRELFSDKDFDDIERTEQAVHSDQNAEADYLLLEQYLRDESSGKASSGALETWSKRHLSAELKSALEKLSPHHRVVLIARELLELSYQEIHVMLDIPQGTVMSRLHRARHALQTELQTHSSQEND
jgi:RNA polymerase sigma-70 factor (ECF subfamily)